MLCIVIICDISSFKSCRDCGRLTTRAGSLLPVLVRGEDFLHTLCSLLHNASWICAICAMHSSFRRMCEALLLKGFRTGEVKVSPGLFLCTQVGHMRWGAVWSMGNGGNCANQEGSFACLGGSGFGWPGSLGPGHGRQGLRWIDFGGWRKLLQMKI